MRRALNCLILAVFALAPMIAVSAVQARDPYSIMVEDGQATVPLPKPVRRARGSSSPSPVPPYRSTVTPPGIAPRTVESYPVDRPSSPSMIVPGVAGSAGPAVTPPRPPGQSFQDRAVACQHSGMGQGVGAGGIGAYTGACVNQ
jgi:hypothetical protein